MPFFTFRKPARSEDGATTSPGTSDGSITLVHVPLTSAQIRRATRTRTIACIATAFLLFVSLILLIMVEIGSTYNMPVLRDIWFVKLDLSQIVPSSFPLAGIINTIAQTLGLHDFYQVGLWGYCEGYTHGVTECTKPRALYYFNPVAIIINSLIAGATIALPGELNAILGTIKLASSWMFGLFLTGACLTFVLIPVVMASVYSRWITFAVTLIVLLDAVIITAACVIGTVMFSIIRNVLSSDSELNIGASLGTTMFGLMWAASACALLAAGIQIALSFCFASRRDVRNGRKRGSKKAYEMKETSPAVYQ